VSGFGHDPGIDQDALDGLVIGLQATPKALQHGEILP
jgi:hypothetical protein